MTDGTIVAAPDGTVGKVLCVTGNYAVVRFYRREGWLDRYWQSSKALDDLSVIYSPAQTHTAPASDHVV